MSLAAGTRLGSYEILAPIGAGGMGEVYRARDTRLKRDVALKVLPDSFARDPERMARFQLEAEVLASLNHPNIASIYGVEDHALIMELVEGESPKGPLPFDEAWKIATQIADALEYAHEKGIIHRDLKPPNVKVTPEGVVKLLDFGLAKAFTAQTEAASNPERSPTVTIRATQAGVILGTAAYMSPEQAKGKAVDKRADIWAFGCVLFELLAGQRAFDGDSVSETLAAVLKTEPDWSALPGATPLHVRRLLKRCIEKDPRKRWRDIGDVRMVSDESMEIVQVPADRRFWLPWGASAVLTVALMIAGIALWLVMRPVEHPLMRLGVDLGPNVAMQTNGGANLILSPDGTRLVFPSNGPNGQPRLSTRLLSQEQSTPITGTEGAHGDAFFSPDGLWIGFFADGKLKKISLQAGTPITLCDAPNPRGGSWGDDNNIVFAPNIGGGLLRVSAYGGTPYPLTEPKGRGSNRWPQVLPGARSVLFTAVDSGPNFENASIEIQSLQTGQRKTLHTGGSYGRYTPSGHLLYVHQGTLFARTFDLQRLELTGPPAPIVEDITNSAVTGSAQFDFSTAPAGLGMLVYQMGKEAQTSIFWLESTGKTQPLYAVPGFYLTPRFSPDGKRLAVALYSGNSGLWLSDLERDALLRLTSTAGDNGPVWSPDGKHIAYVSAQTGIYWVRSDASTTPERLTRSEYITFPYSFSPDGRRLVS